MNMATTAMWFNGFNSLANFCTDPKSFDENQFLKSLGSGLTLIQTELEMFKLLQLGLVTLIHFKIENLFRNLCEHFKLPSKKRYGFWHLTNLIYRSCSICDGEPKNSLIALTNIRNSLHNNGIHSHKSVTLQIGQIHYEFIEGGPINCASWEEIMNLFKFNVSALREVLLSEKIGSFEGLVIDLYSSQFEI